MTDDPYSGDTKMLKGSGGAFRRRVGEWRIIFDTVPERHLIVVTEIARRGSHTY
jgi:mRNA-degrading endonuclease RelE of RelBE toxin-antitoxin system